MRFYFVTLDGENKLTLAKEGDRLLTGFEDGTVADAQEGDDVLALLRQYGEPDEFVLVGRENCEYEASDVSESNTTTEN